LVPVGIGFTLQIVGQKHAPPADAALIMSLESVFGALSGFVYLGEKLAWIQIAGCVLIFSAIILSQYAGLAQVRETVREIGP
jgi:drug/metabolite transporter (DMT)-like permease